MKHSGSRCEYSDQRDLQLFLAFRRIIMSSPDINFSTIARRVVTTPTTRFWVSESRAAIVISAMLKGRNPLASMNATRQLMYREIYRRVTCLLRTSPQLPLTAAVARVISSPAPQFYLTPSSARIIYYRVKARLLLPHLQQAHRHATLAAALRTHHTNHSATSNHEQHKH